MGTGTGLYVEDEQAAREEVLVFLRRRAREILVAANGEEGLALFREKRPELVITDIRMPVLDGLGMAKAIKALDPDVKIIITSAHGDTPSLLAAIDSDVDAYVMKPLETGKLLAAMTKCAEVIEYRRTALRHREEQQKSLEQLQAALAKVKLLSGFIPICASCKKIRNDAGFWQQIEVYIRDHSEAEFSHGLCPDCVKQFFQDRGP